MNLICLILFLLVASIWYFTNEYTTISGIYMPAEAMRSNFFKFIAGVLIILAVFFTCFFWSERASILYQAFHGIDSRSVLIVLLSSLITLVVLKFFSVSGSVVYAIAGSVVAYNLFSGRMPDKLHIYGLWIVAAPIFCFVLSYIIRSLFRLLEKKTHIHLMVLSHYMRYAVTACIIVTSLALGVNWGGFIAAGSDAMASSDLSLFLIPIILAVIIMLTFRFRADYSEENTSIYSDFSIYTILSVGISVSLILIICPFPLSVNSLVVAAIAGDEVLRRIPLLSSREYLREGIALVAVPVLSFLLSYVIFYLSGIVEGDHLMDFTVMASFVLILVALFFAAYVRKQARQKEVVDRLVYSQQQQIYDHSKALNDMELKVVLSENQALHNAVEMKRQEVMNVALSIVEQKEYLESLNTIVKKLSCENDEKEKERLIAELSRSLKQRLSYDRDVDSQYFYAKAESLHEDFNAKLSENFPTMTPQEKRLATLLRLGFSSKYIATLMNITTKSVEISRYRLRQKLGLSKGDNLVNFIKSI